MHERRLYVVTKRGQEGPFELQELGNLVRSGRIALDDQLRTGRGQTEGTVRDYLDYESGMIEAVDVEDERDDHREALEDFADGRQGLRNRPLIIAGIGAVLIVICLAYFTLRSTQPALPPPEPVRRLPVVSIEAESASWLAGRDGAVIVRIDQPQTQPLTMPLQISGTAIPKIDFPPIPEQVTIPAGKVSVRLPVVALPVTNARNPSVVVIATLGDSSEWTVTQPATVAVQLACEEDAQVQEAKVVWLEERKPLKFVSWTPAAPTSNPTTVAERTGARRHTLAATGDMVIEGVRYSHGLILHAGVTDVDPESTATYAIAPNDQEFLCEIGISDDIKGGKGANFQVWVDDKPELNSGVIGVDDPAKKIRIPVAGAHELRLVVTAAGGGNISAKGIWGGARLVQKSPAH